MAILSRIGDICRILISLYDDFCHEFWKGQLNIDANIVGSL